MTKKQDLLNRVHERAFLNLLLDLIEISDSFDQLQKLALITDLLFSPFEEQYKELAKGLEHTARHLRGLPVIGNQEPSACHSIPIPPEGTAGLCGLPNCRCKAELEKTGLFDGSI